MILKTGSSEDKDLCKFRAGSELRLVNGHPNIGVPNGNCLRKLSRTWIVISKPL